jgi:hypothetical protein
MQIKTEETIIMGKPVSITVMKVDNHQVIVTGRLIKTAKIKEEWDEDVEDPHALVVNLKKSGVKADIFTFIQRLPESKPKFNFYMEWDNVAAIPIKNYDHWFKEQLHQNPRNKIRIAQKKGVVVKICDFDDEFIRGINDIYNETPIRQGRPYWNYGMDFDLTKKENTPFLDRSMFIGAYYKDELIGYIRLVDTKRYVRTMGILGKIAHRDKAPMNVMIAKAVEICAEKRIPYLVYAKFNYGKVGSDTLADFKLYNGFESIMLPRYYIPLTLFGRIIIKFNMHHGLVGIIPERSIRLLLNLRNKWYKKNTQ